MDKALSTRKVKNFRQKIFDLTNQELELRSRMKLLYEQLVLDAGDSEIALRHARQAYYQIQKHRLTKLTEELLEFHPFFGANSIKSPLDEQEDEEEDDDDGIV